MMRALIIATLALLISCESTDHGQADLLDLFLDFNEPSLQKVVDDPRYELQFRYTEIDRSDDGQITLQHHNYGIDTTQYFYPASTVKMPVAILALQRLQELGLEPTDDMLTDSIRPPQSIAHLDDSSLTGMPNVQQYIKRLFAVSDNNAYNRLFELLGSAYVNDQLRKKGAFTNSRIRTRVGVGGFSDEEQRYTNPIRFYRDGTLIYEQPSLYDNNTDYVGIDDCIKGAGYIGDQENLISEPFDFCAKNFINVIDLESVMMRVIIPEYFSESDRFDLSEDDYSLLRSAMHTLPKTHTDIGYDPTTYYDSYVKFFMFGDSKEPMPDNIKIYNKVGYAYGYLTDVAYIQDTANDIEFFLTATVHVNANQIYNDGIYEYDDIGIPFLARLGTYVYEHELAKLQ